MTLMGEAVYERAYYHCKHCRHGFFPTDEEFRIEDKKTPATREVTALAGVTHPFDEAATEVLPKMSGIKLSASSIQKITETVGEDVAQKRAAEETFGPEANWDWHTDASGKTVAYIGLDATGVPQQGPHAEQRECRMALVGVIFNPNLQTKKRKTRTARRDQSTAVNWRLSTHWQAAGGRSKARQCLGCGIHVIFRV